MSSSMGTSTGNALPRTGIGNLRVWVPTYVSTTLSINVCTHYQVKKAKKKIDAENTKYKMHTYSIKASPETLI